MSRQWYIPYYIEKDESNDHVLSDSTEKFISIMTTSRIPAAAKKIIN